MFEVWGAWGLGDLGFRVWEATMWNLGLRGAHADGSFGLCILSV